ncbi:hypothetical protein KKA08_07840, partial [bacterium]|nr:hypothetical protein [bacterium]
SISPVASATLIEIWTSEFRRMGKGFGEVMLGDESVEVKGDPDYRMEELFRPRIALISKVYRELIIHFWMEILS